MKTKFSSGLIKLFSLILVISMLLSACDVFSGNALSGSAGLDETPTEEIAEVPTEEDGGEPTEEITEAPTEETGGEPTEGITETPTVEGGEPTEEITEVPTEESGGEPTEEITEAPTEDMVVGETTATLTPTLTSTLDGQGIQSVSEEWDRSSISVSGICLKDGKAEFVIHNNGSAMTGPINWSMYVDDVLTDSGEVQLGEDESITLAFGPYNGQKVKMEVFQRPGHPGQGVAYADTTCTVAQPTNTNTPQPDPRVGLSVACNNDLSATFTITNIGAPLTNGTYTISEPGKPMQSGSLNLGTNQSVSFNTVGNATITVFYTTSQLERVDLSATGTCIPFQTNTPKKSQFPPIHQPLPKRQPPLKQLHQLKLLHQQKQ